jgi:hypothetical protein
MFRMDCERAHTVEEALIRFGGPGAQDLEIQEDVAPAA